MANHPLLLVGDECSEFFSLFKCVNMVSTYSSTSLESPGNAETIASGHLRCQQTQFVENMSRHIYPLHDSCTHLSFPGSTSKNMTTRGSDVDRLYFASIHSSYNGFANGKFGTVQCGFQTNNRNYNTLIHGVENRKDCIAGLEEKESVSFTRNCSFPPLKTSLLSSLDILSQHQIYDNSFSINSQRQTDDSLMETGKKLLTKIRQFAMADVSLNNFCVSKELSLQRHLSLYEKCQLLIFHEVMRYKFRTDPTGFQEKCANFLPQPYDTTFHKYIFSTRRKKRQNPELVDIFHILPIGLQSVIIDRWAAEGKLTTLFQSVIMSPDKTLDIKLQPPLQDVLHWSEEDIQLLAIAVFNEISTAPWKI